MKRFFYILFPMLSVLSVSASNYLMIGDSCSLRISPAYLGSSVTVPVGFHFDSRVDYWHLEIDYGSGLSCTNAYRGSDMDVQYQDSLGNDAVYQAALSSLLSYTIMYSSIPIMGYWDYNGSGNYSPYGTVKWEPGDHSNMFDLRLDVNNSLRDDTVHIDCTLTSGGDVRGQAIVSAIFHADVIVHVGYQLGDVDGNDRVNVSDVTTLINFLLNPLTDPLDEFQLAAADVNGDGLVNISDVTTLSNSLHKQAASGEQ